MVAFNLTLLQQLRHHHDHAFGSTLNDANAEASALAIAYAMNPYAIASRLGNAGSGSHDGHQFPGMGGIYGGTDGAGVSLLNRATTAAMSALNAEGLSLGPGTGGGTNPANDSEAIAKEIMMWPQYNGTLHLSLYLSYSRFAYSLPFTPSSTLPLTSPLLFPFHVLYP